MMEKEKMQVINDENFIFVSSNTNFGGLYKYGKGSVGFLNTFTA